MALTAQQIADGATAFAREVFAAGGQTATLSTTDIQAALQAIDNAMNATLNQAVAVAGGTTKVVSALQQQIVAAAPGATVPQQALLLNYWAKKAAGL